MKYPLHIRDIIQSDPFILADPVTKKYYTYAARFNPDRFKQQKAKGVFHALVSEDLINWSEPVQVFEKGDFWSDLDYWAPECHIWNDKYYIFSTFRASGKYRVCQCLVADDPLGPFAPAGKGPVTPKGWQCLDGSLYIDRKNKPWMVFCHEWMQVYDGQIAIVPLSDDLSESIGEPTILFRASDAPWRHTEPSYVTDGCFTHRCKDGSLIMLWSSFSEFGYTTGYAKSLSGEITGPWEQVKDPLYALDGGHPMLFYTFDGKLMMSLHSPNVHGKKRILLFEMEEKGSDLQIINECTGNWFEKRDDGRGSMYKFKEDCTEDPCFPK